jgi:broad specificity phosphatase PhoE
MTILLVRHGETDLNAARILQPPDTPLGRNGLAQAAAVAARIAALAPVALLSSNLRRAWQTAEAIAAAPGLAIEPEALLHERNFGDWRGRPWGEMEIDPLGHPDAPPNGEAMVDFFERVAAAWAAIVARRGALHGPLVVVSHGLTIHRMLAAHVELPAGLTLPLRLHNTAVSEVEATPPHRVLTLGCTRHLP